jgi:hypothetical protein
LRYINDESHVDCGGKAKVKSKIALLLTLLSKINSQGNIRWSARTSEKNNTVSALLVVFSEEIC